MPDTTGRDLACPFCGEELDEHRRNGTARYSCECGFRFDVEDELPAFPALPDPEMTPVEARMDLLREWCRKPQEWKNRAQPPDYQRVRDILNMGAR